MAKFIPSTPFTEALLNDNDGLTTDVTDAVSYVSKAYRAIIILDRNARGFEKEHVNGDPNAYHHENTFGQSLGTSTKAHREQIEQPAPADPNNYQFEPAPTDKNLKDHRTNEDGTIKNEPTPGSPLDYRFEEANKRVVRTFKKDYISIIDLDFNVDTNAKRKYATLNLPFTPKGLKYTINSNFVAIATMGRNNPHYHFTGSEDTLEFEIDWHSYQNNREDVIFLCRWMESLTKGNGYDEAPHRVKLAWGQDSVMFEDDIWICTNASYDLSQFVDAYNDTNDREKFTKVGMLPQQAMQKITLKRISEFNRFGDDIMGQFNFPNSGVNEHVHVPEPRF